MSAQVELAGRTAFVTGGAQGIGLGIAKACAAREMNVAIADVDEAALGAAEAELSLATKVVAARLDVRDREGFARVADEVEGRLGPVWLLANNAGTAGQAAVTNMSYAAWDWVVGINLGGVYNGLQTFVPRMLDRGEGHVVNTASAAGLLGNPGFAYACSKYGVVGISESLRIELAPHGIGVSVLCPGAVNTSIFEHSIASAPTTPDGEVVTAGTEDFFAMMRPVLASGASPDDVGRLVLDAVSEDRLFILTDAALAPYLEQRTAEIVAAMPAPD